VIENYQAHSANERTFLAWVRTGIAVMAFGFVIERFNLFLLTIANSTIGAPADRAELARVSGHFGRNEGFALIIAGIALVLVATWRFARTTRLIDDAIVHPAKNVRAELIFATALVVLVASYGVYLALS
jgi:putative membrane protein